ncbi:MAG: peptidoglycan DD-metalloendopeptidase family protein [Lachnospiraceae bacterium]|nr:peptidoglycan DD-metalloendopeptidase family protein [Lachnospiraceae bacterium]
MKKNKRIIYSIAALVLGFSLMIPTSAAKSVSDVKDEKKELEDKLDDVESQVADLKAKSASTQEYIDKLDEQLAGLSNQLVKLEQELRADEEELAKTQTELEEAKAKKDKQYDDMKKRIKFMYENGETAYLEMILEAENFTDMLNKADYVKSISEYDRNMLVEFQNTVQGISDKEQKIQQKVAEVEKKKADVEKQKSSVETLNGTKKQEMENYKQEIAKSQELASQYESEIDAQEELIAKLEAEAARKAEEARKKKEAEEAARKEAERKAAEKKAAEDKAKKDTEKKDNSSTKPAPSDDSGSPSTGGSSSGWTWPCPGHTTINSDYGYRIHPILGTRKMHNGIDIKAGTGTPIVAAKSGTVIAAAYNSSMGNYVIIDHGSGISTVYMHCSSLAVSSGKSVNAGETIAYVGSTGQSTAAHLHFSVRLNSVYVNPWNYVSR